MPDGLGYTEGAGKTVATDDCGAAGHAQIVKVGYGANGSATVVPADSSGLYVQGAALPGTTAAGNPILLGGQAESTAPTAVTDGQAIMAWFTLNGSLVATPSNRVTKIAVTPTIATANYAANDFMGAALNFTNAALVAGRSGKIVNCVLTSRTVVANAYELWLFETSPTIASADNAPFDMTDANLETAKLFAVVDFLVADNKASASNQVCMGTIKGVPVSQVQPKYVATTTSIYGALIARTVAGQLAGTTDLIVNLWVEPD